MFLFEPELSFVSTNLLALTAAPLMTLLLTCPPLVVLPPSRCKYANRRPPMQLCAIKQKYTFRLCFVASYCLDRPSRAPCSSIHVPSPGVISDQPPETVQS